MDSAREERLYFWCHTANQLASTSFERIFLHVLLGAACTTWELLNTHPDDIAYGGDTHFQEYHLRQLMFSHTKRTSAEHKACWSNNLFFFSSTALLTYFAVACSSIIDNSIFLLHFYSVVDGAFTFLSGLKRHVGWEILNTHSWPRWPRWNLVWRWDTFSWVPSPSLGRYVILSHKNTYLLSTKACSLSDSIFFFWAPPFDLFLGACFLLFAFKP